MSKLPPISDELRPARPKLDVALEPKVDLPDDAIEARSRAIGQRWGSATHPPTPKKPAKPVAPLVSIRFDAPDYLDRELAVKAAEQGVTKTFLILTALGAAGYRLDDADLVKDRRRWKQR